MHNYSTDRATRKLIEKVAGAESAIVFEVVYKTSGKSDYKVGQASRGVAFLQDATGKEVYGGIVCSRIRNGERFKSPRGLDLILQVDRFQKDAAEDALSRIAFAGTEDEQNITRRMRKLVRWGIPLQNFLDVDYTEWRDGDVRGVLEKAVRNPTNLSEYRRRISGVKGRILPSYVREVFKREAPNCTVFSERLYEHGGKESDLDLVIIGPEEDIIRAATHPDYFVPLQQAPEVRKLSRRLELVR